MFGKTYELSLNKQYVRHWGVIEAVRELIQNALDSDSPFQYEFIKAEDDLWTLSLTSSNATLSPQSLLLGATSKAELDDKIGSFGEGYKIALLVLTREGHKVEIANGSVIWEPFFRFSNKYQDDLLCIGEWNAPVKQQGVIFYVGGLSEEQVQDIRNSCLQMQQHIGELKATTYGDILLEKSGCLYVGGLYICRTELKYGYNINPRFIKLERDRRTVDTWDLQTLTKEMWFETKLWDDIAKMIEAEVPDVEYARWSSPELVKEACYRLFRSKHPNAIIAESHTQLKEMVANGMKEVVYIGGNYGGVVTHSESYKQFAAKAIETQKAPHLQMQEWLDKSKYRMHADVIATFKALIVTAERNWKIK